MVTVLEIRLLGAPSIELDGRPIDVDTRKATALLAYLALTGQRHGRDALAAFFWPEASASRARGALRRTLSTLNLALGAGWLLVDRDAVGLRQDAGVWLDVSEYRRLVVESATLRCALELCHADFMAGFTLRDSPAFDDWQLYESETLRAEQAQALERLVALELDVGELQAAIGAARRRLALDALHEPSHQRLIECYARAGQRGAALRQYRECVRVLERELGVPPLPATVALYEAIRDQRIAPSEPPLPATHTAWTSLPCVGRDDELAALERAWARVGPDGVVFALDGEAGVGKTRLAEEFLRLVRMRGGVTLTARCYAGEANLSFAPIVDALRGGLERLRSAGLDSATLTDVSRLLPELAVPSVFPPPLDSPGAQARFYEALAAACMAATQTVSATPGVVFIDDAHWADVATLDLLGYLIHRLARRPLLVLLATRAEDAGADWRLRGVLSEAQRAGRGQQLTLRRLDRAASSALVASALTAADATRLSERLYAETEGLPFFLTEYLAALNTLDDAADHEWTAPPGVSSLLHERLAQVSETGRQLLAAAAVIGRAFDFDTLRDVSGRGDEETVSALEALLAVRLLAELGAGEPAAQVSYDFTHGRLRALVYDETSLARRRLLHYRVAEVLSRHARGSAGAAGAAQLAYHFRQAGRAADALNQFRRAGDRARDLYANSDAVAHYRAALALAADAVTAAALHAAIGDLQTLLGDYDAALLSYGEVAARAPSTQLPALEHTLAALHHRRGEWQLAESHYRAALAPAESLPPARQARVLADWSLTAHHAGRVAEALQLGTRALELADAAGDTAAQAQAHNLLGVLARARGDLPEATRHLEESLALAHALGDLLARVAALNNLALVCFARAEAPRAVALAQEALELCAQRGDRHRQAALHNNLADFLHFSGQPDAALTHLKQAVTIFAEIGDSIAAEEMQPEIWKLSEW